MLRSGTDVVYTTQNYITLYQDDFESGEEAGEEEEEEEEEQKKDRVREEDRGREGKLSEEAEAGDTDSEAEEIKLQQRAWLMEQVDDITAYPACKRVLRGVVVVAL